MTNRRMTVLLIGATGSIGRLVVDEVIRQGHAVGAAWGQATAVATCEGAAHFVERAASLYVVGRRHYACNSKGYR